MFHTAIEKLEFKSVVERIRRYAASEPGKECVEAIIPLTDPEEIRRQLKLVSEGKELLIAEGGLPLDGLKPIGVALKKTFIENRILTTKELWDIAATLAAARTTSLFFSKHRIQYPLLVELAEPLFYDKVVEFNIQQAVDEDGNVKDTASRELRRIRTEIVSVSETLRKRLQSILRRISEQDILQEEIITTRDGRLVIPIKTEFKRKVEGFVHTASASGATVYVEPAETLALNNDLLELHLREQREIETILRDLTGQVREIAESLLKSIEILSVLDLISAKAKYSIEVIGTSPEISDNGKIILSQARHPVLLIKHKREEVIPLTIELGEQNHTLVITGPNAGGKSVAMKTIGILALCAQSGIHIPASVESTLPVFHKIFVDIGDEQSIENDLSTFSSHLLRLSEILDKADARSLVLIDEIGAGTDPAEGSALAESVLEELTRRKAMTVTTTHHGALKVFAHQTHGVANGSMEFDQESLKPTYKFRIGIPGSSFALELAERMGIPPAIRDEARRKMGAQQSSFEQLIIDLEKRSQRLEQELDIAGKERRRFESLAADYDSKMKEVRKEITVIKSQAQQDAKALLENAQALIENTIREIKEKQAEKSSVKSAREQVSRMEQELQPEHPLRSDEKSGELAIGDYVKIFDGSSLGEVVDIRGRFITVQTGSSKITVSMDGATKVEGKRNEVKTAGPSEYTAAPANEVDVRGMTGDEAVTAVEKFLDDAYVSGFHKAHIIHGKGTGVLRKRVLAFLKTYPRALKYQLGEWNEGGDGVTVVELVD